MVLKWINLNPISLPYILHQKIVSPNKIDLWKTGLHEYRNGNDIWSSFSFHFFKVFQNQIDFLFNSNKYHFLHEHCFKTPILQKLEYVCYFRYMFSKQGTLQIIEDKTNIYGTLSCRLLSFAKFRLSLI